MLDTYHPNPKRSEDWRDHLSWGDIVSFRFPILDPPLTDKTPKKRPCLIIDRDPKDGIPMVTIAYGTSQDTRKTRGYDLAVTSQTGILAAGLHKPTRFLCCRHVHVPLSHSGFVWLAKTKSPVMGSLQGEDLELMSRIRARLQTQADSAAGLRKRRRFYGRRPIQTRSFTFITPHAASAPHS
ncbi:type II toxin-antitoxin system PemK/MazF family toxin [Shimia litoralis]|nr:type II toxin-antitoxin system PemK/MazF family toxin [Shimia litoralis]